MDVLHANLKTAPPGPAKTAVPGGPHNFMFAGLIDGLFAPGESAPAPRLEPRDRSARPEDDPRPEPTAPTARPAPAKAARVVSETIDPATPLAAPVVASAPEPADRLPQAMAAIGEAIPGATPPASTPPETTPDNSVATPQAPPLTPQETAEPSAELPADTAALSRTTAPVATAAPGPDKAPAPAADAAPATGAPPAPPESNTDVRRAPRAASNGPDKTAEAGPDRPADQPIPVRDGTRGDATPRDAAAFDQDIATESGDDRPLPVAFRRAGHPGSVAADGRATDGPAADLGEAAGESAADKPGARMTADILAALARPAAPVPRSLPTASVAGKIGGDAFASQLVAGNGNETRTRVRQAPLPTPAPAPRPAPALDQIALHIRRAAADGLDRIRIQLKPAELGRVDIRLEIGNDNRVAALVTVDRPETLDLLQRDARGLERALEDAGLKPDGGNLEFSLGGERAGGFASALGDARPTEDTDESDPSVAEAPPSNEEWTSDALLDIQV